ncbi:MAG: 3-hydroxyacyl-CoA dehydrogenase family protein [Deltaproteobacteria bacterium]|nr:3-hydroxyacyl-CoA dehydrogenase family protein [Deltaproteobacteria bacterium]
MAIENTRKLTVIGAGKIGKGIAEAALLAGYEVGLRDRTKTLVKRSLVSLTNTLKKSLTENRISREQHNRITKDLLHGSAVMKDALRGADIVVEAVPELLDLKKSIFKEIDKSGPTQAILSTTTSTLSVTEIALSTKRPEKVLGLHFFSPVVLTKVVETVRGDHTDENTMIFAQKFCESLGKIPVRVNKDSPGFVVNRIQAPAGVLLGAIVDRGIALPEEIDALLIKLGKPMGHFKLLDITGIDLSYETSNYFSTALSRDFAPFSLMKRKVEAGEYGKKTGRGFYDWSKGTPDIDIDKATKKVDPKDLIAVQINEATKLIEWEITTADEIDKAIVNITKTNEGPMGQAQRFKPAGLAKRLRRLSKEFKKAIFEPTCMICEGKYLTRQH